jgi:hypothetical protein
MGRRGPTVVARGCGARLGASWQAAAIMSEIQRRANEPGARPAADGSVGPGRGLKGVVDGITCPLPVVHGEDDCLCSPDGCPYTIPSLFDWLVDRVGANAGGGR